MAVRIDRAATRKTIKADGAEVTELTDTDGKEITNVWVQDGYVYWDDPGACTVHVGSAWEFAQWCIARIIQ